MMKISFETVQSWNKQNANEVMNTAPSLNHAEMEIFKAGLLRGFNDAVSLFKLHGYIEMDYK